MSPERASALAMADHHRRLADPWAALRWPEKSRGRLAAKHRRKWQKLEARAAKLEASHAR